MIKRILLVIILVFFVPFVFILFKKEFLFNINKEKIIKNILPKNSIQINIISILKIIIINKIITISITIQLINIVMKLMQTELSLL